MQITIPFKTPSVNHLYFVWRNRKILTKEARNLKKQILDIVCPFQNQLFSGRLHNNELLKVNIAIYEPWYFKNGNVATKDLLNREKFLIDAVFEGLKIDDRFIWECTFRKVDNDTEQAIINIEVL